MNRSLKKAAPLAAALLAAGCAVGPDFKSPPAPATPGYLAGDTPQATSATPVEGGQAQHFVAGQPVPSRWWTLYQSPQLDALVDRAFKGSPTVDAAQAALREAQQTLKADKANLFPFLDANASATREKTSNTAFGGSGTNLFNLYNASLDVSYGLDLFGGVRRALEAQLAQTDYTRFQLAATYQTLAANVVTAAVQSASLQAQIEATQAILGAQQSELDITERQFALGAVSSAEVLSARSNLATTRAGLPPLLQQLDQTQNQLAVYEGRLPAERVEPPFKLADLKLPESIPLSLPSELVRQRPDVQESEALLHQASAQIGVAIANRLPQITINGSYGTQASHTGDLFSDGIWSLGANLTQPLFHAGELAAKQRAAQAAYDQAAANYRQTVLQAFQDVADSLRALQRDADVLQAQQEAASTAQQSLQLIDHQYRLGGASYLSLLNAQRQYQQTQIAYVQALAARQADTAALFQALGGGVLNAASTTADGDSGAGSQ